MTKYQEAIETLESVANTYMYYMEDEGHDMDYLSEKIEKCIGYIEEVIKEKGK